LEEKVDVCDCWWQIVSVGTRAGLVRMDIEKRQWKKAKEETVPKVKEALDRLEECSGMRMMGARTAVYELETKAIPRYDFFTALTLTEKIMDELVYDVGCRKRKL